MDNIMEISLLLDFYGQLLTPRQYEVLDLHYNSDYSLGEIGELLKISRQGVYDNIKRGKAVLFDLEERLGLIGRFSKQRDKAKEALILIDTVDITALSDSDQGKLETIKQTIREMVED